MKKILDTAKTSEYLGICFLRKSFFFLVFDDLKISGPMLWLSFYKSIRSKARIAIFQFIPH